VNATAWVLISAINLLIGYDVYAAIRWGYTGTISYDVLQASLRHPIIPFAAGVIAGHLFWNQ
jgi:hypothetical protein